MSNGSTKPARASTFELTIPEGGVANATPATAELTTIVRKKANRLSVIVVFIIPPCGNS
jgi:hypothetical protein